MAGRFDSQSPFVLSPIAAARKKMKKNRKNPGVMDSFVKRFTTQRQKCDINPNENGPSIVIRDDSEKEDEKLNTVIVPDGDFLIYWLTVVSVAVVYNLWVLIAREAWPDMQDHSPAAWFVADYFCDFIYVLDIVVQARTGYLEQGIIVTDGKKLLCHYMKSWRFKIDILSLLPTDLLYLLNTDRMHPMFRCPRFLRTYRFYLWYVKVENRTHVPNIFRVSYLTHILLLGLHWTGAAYYLICEAIGPSSFTADLGHNNSTALKYLQSFYWSTLTLTTIGDLPEPQHEVEYVVQIIGYLVGIFIFATVVGQVGNIIGNNNASRMEYERQVDRTKRYMRKNNVPRDVQLRILRWYDYTWTRRVTKGQGDVNSLSLLPDRHRIELALHVNLQTLKRVSILKTCPPEFLHDLVLKMHLCIFTPDDLVCRKGEVAREMFIVSDGLFKVNDDSGHVVNTYKSGDYFGEIGILNLEGNDNRRTTDVYSVGFSELFTLSKEDILGVLKDYPAVQSMIEEEARRRLQRTLVPEGINGTGVGMANVRFNIHSEISRPKSHLEVPEEVTPRVKYTKRQTSRDSRARDSRAISALIDSAGTLSSSPGSAAIPGEIEMDNILPFERGASEKVFSNAANAAKSSRGKEPNMDAKEMIWALRKENESKTAYIQALEKRNKELEALLKATSPFKTADSEV